MRYWDVTQYSRQKFITIESNNIIIDLPSPQDESDLSELKHLLTQWETGFMAEVIEIINPTYKWHIEEENSLIFLQEISKLPIEQQEILKRLVSYKIYIQFYEDGFRCKITNDNSLIQDLFFNYKKLEIDLINFSLIEPIIRKDLFLAKIEKE